MPILYPQLRLGLLAIFILSFLFKGLSQPINNLLGDITQPSPEAAALGKYGDIPVNLYTGVPSIAVPLYTIQEGPLSLPLSLSYHASGVKPGERASWVGLGWSLSAGGIVTRSVLGINDDAPSGYYYTGATLTTNLSDQVLVAQGQKDAEPDIFTYNLGTYSGKFYIDKNQNRILVPRNDLKITPLFYGQEFSGFLIVTPDGTKYYFGDDPDDGLPPKGIEVTTVNVPGGSETHNSSWFPVKITTFDHKFSILFEYNDRFSYRIDPGTCRYAKNYSFYGGQHCSTQGVACTGSEAGGAWTETEIAGKELKRIATSTSTTTVDFTPSTSNREDYSGGRRLDKIKIQQGTGNTYCMSWEMQYSYWQDTYNPPGYPLELTKHLRLNNLTLKNCDTGAPITDQTYSFEYESAGYSSTYLPAVYSKAVDHWGFCNGKTANNNNQVNAPPTTVTNGNATITYGQSDRETDTAKVKLGVLRKIHYPTGGYTRFEFEANTYPRHQIVDSTVTQKLSLTTPSCPYDPCCSGDSPLGTVTLTSPPAEYYFNLSLLSNGTCLGDRTVYVYVYNNSGGYLGAYGFNWSSSGNNLMMNKPLTLFGITFVQGQTYKFQVVADAAIGSFKLFHRVYTYGWYNAPVGGLRVKKIVNNPAQSAGTEEVVATYEYTESAGSSNSSGLLYRKPSYGFGYSASGNPSGNYSMILGQSAVPLGDYEGYHIGYKRVVEIRPNNGKTIYEFEYETPNPNPGVYPYPPAEARVRTGQTKKSQVYLENQTLIQESSVTPVNDSYTSSVGPIYKIFRISYAQGCSGAPVNYYVNLYTPRTSVYRVSTKTDLTDGVTATTSYIYHNSYWQLIKETSSTIDGIVNKVKYKYPYDWIVSPLRTRMLDENRVAIPVETTKEVDNVVVEGTKTDFSFYNNTTGLPTTTSSSVYPVYPWKFNRYEMTWVNGVPTTGAWILKGTIDKYDISKGKVMQFTQANWPSETYTWSSNGLLQTRTYLGYTWQYDYHPGTRLLRLTTDIDGLKTGFDYDNFMRLKKATKDNASVNGSGVVTDGNVKTEYTYHFKEPGDQNNWIKVKNTFTATSGSNLTNIESFEYFDGLGRTLQMVKKAWSPDQKDVVTAIAYDNLGRVVKQYTPFETNTNTGALAVVPVSQKYTLQQYEASPLGRILSVTPPDWYAVATTYGTNNSSEVGYYDGINLTSFYPANSLVKTTVTVPQDLNKNIETTTYIDKKGRVVLTRRRQAGTSTNADTYVFYDPKGRVTRVLPPDSGPSINDANLRFEYAYDAMDHIIYKKLPDMVNGGITMKYNNRNLMVLAQDGNLKTANKWLLTKYDDYGRPTHTGIHTSASPNPNDAALNFSEQHTITTYGTTGIEIGKVKTLQTWIPGFSTTITRTFTYNSLTGRLYTNNGNNHLNTATGTDDYTYSYDFAGNQISEVRTHKASPSGTTLTLTNRSTYDHSGRHAGLYHTIVTNGVNNGEKQLAQYKYDFRDRLVERNLGAVSNAGINSFLQSIDYKYNEQNWLEAINDPSSFGALSQTAINLCSINPATPNPAEAAYGTDPDPNDVFKLNIYYDNPGFAFGTPTGQRNGNISQFVWQVRGRERQGYTLQYDYLDRIQSAYYTDIRSSGATSSDNKFQEDIIYQDARGNISTILRKGMYKTPISASCFTNGVIDDLRFTYVPGYNRIQSITDAASVSLAKAQGFNPGPGTGTYTYDNNGNLTYDPYKTMSIQYNHLNLPTQMTIPVGTGGAERNIYLLYNRTGEKLRKTVNDQGPNLYIQDYVNGLEYRTTGTGPLVLEAIYHAEGRITGAELNYQYEYNIKDHLGSTRLTFADLNNNKIVDVPGDILQENHYYPFGMNMNYGWMNNITPNSKYQYNGKEWNDDFALNWNDYGARWYDASVGRWWSVDPLGEKNFNFNSYNYTLCNPVKYIDPDGKDNIIYLLALPGNNNNKNVNFESIMKTLGIYLKDTEINVKIELVTDPLNFDINKLDKTDAVAVIGGTKKEAADYIEKNFSGWVHEDFVNGKIGDGRSLTSWLNAKFNPEISDGHGKGDWSYVIATTTQEFEDTRRSQYDKPSFINIAGFLGLKSENINTLIAFTILHGIGHISGVGHNESGTTFMAEGNYLKLFIENDGGQVDSLVKQSAAKNPSVMDKINNRFKKEVEPKLNYDPK